MFNNIKINYNSPLQYKSSQCEWTKRDPNHFNYPV
jgi:hypothetical protein